MWFGWATEDGEIQAGGHLKEAFIEDMAPIAVSRYMETMRTNRSLDQRVADMEVPKSEWDTWPEGSGVPLSYVAEHSRLLAEVYPWHRPWINFPHMGLDEIAIHGAEVLRGRRPIVEYSNELFNTAPNMTQSSWAAAQTGNAYSDERGQRREAYRFGAQRTREIAALWLAIDPEAEIIFSIGATDPPGDEIGDIWHHVDGAATAAYFGQEIAWANSQWEHHQHDSADELFDWLIGEALDRMEARLRARRSEVPSHLPLHIYEGGHHVWDYNNPHIVTLKREPRFGELLTAWMERLEAIVGIGIVCHYITTGPMENNPFALKEWTGQPETEAHAWAAYAAKAGVI
jgi:hypothetical protein